MIFEITTYKYTNKKPSESKLEQIKDFLVSNPDNWFKSKDLEYIFEYKSIRQIINKLRIDGVPIISDTHKGYKFTNNKDEIKKCSDDLRKRALIQLTAAKKMQRFI